MERQKERPPAARPAVFTESAAEAVSVSAAAAQQQKDPDDVAAASASAVRAAYVRSAVSAAAAQQKDQEDNVAAVSSCRTVTSAATVCCRQIAHALFLQIF